MSNDTMELRKYLTMGQGEIAKAIRGAITPELMIRATLTYAQKNPKVFDCTKESIAKCLMDCAALGLLPDGTLGTAYLVPYGTSCTLIIGYRGLIELARRSGQLTSIEAHVVREGDQFQCEFGLVPVLKHVPKLEGAMDRPVVAAYAIAHFKDGSHHCEVMGKSEVDAIRARSRAGGSGPWVSDYAEMAKKTVVRRLMKYMPLTPEMADTFEATDREYIKDSDVSEALAQRSAKKADALAKRLSHAPQPDINAEVEAAQAEREAAAANAVEADNGGGEPVRPVSTEPQAEGQQPDESPPPESDVLTPNTKVFVRHMGKKLVSLKPGDMSDTDLSDAHEANEAALADPGLDAKGKAHRLGVKNLLEEEMGNRRQ
jgi:recombination protein RecT